MDSLNFPSSSPRLLGISISNRPSAISPVARANCRIYRVNPRIKGSQQATDRSTTARISPAYGLKSKKNGLLQREGNIQTSVPCNGCRNDEFRTGMRAPAQYIVGFRVLIR